MTAEAASLNLFELIVAKRVATVIHGKLTRGARYGGISTLLLTYQIVTCRSADY